MTVCWGVYLAIPEGKQPPDFAAGPTSDMDENLGAWPVDNPWIPLVFGDLWRGWLVGHAKHCSCGCVISNRKRQTIALTQTVRNYLADIADVAGLIGAGIHWTSGQFRSEELPFDVSGSVSSDQLRSSRPADFLPDAFCYVHSQSQQRTPLI